MKRTTKRCKSKKSILKDTALLTYDNTKLEQNGPHSMQNATLMTAESDFFLILKKENCNQKLVKSTFDKKNHTHKLNRMTTNSEWNQANESKTRQLNKLQTRFSTQNKLYYIDVVVPLTAIEFVDKNVGRGCVGLRCVSAFTFTFSEISFAATICHAHRHSPSLSVSCIHSSGVPHHCYYTHRHVPLRFEFAICRDSVSLCFHTQQTVTTVARQLCDDGVKGFDHVYFWCTCFYFGQFRIIYSQTGTPPFDKHVYTHAHRFVCDAMCFVPLHLLRLPFQCISNNLIRGGAFTVRSDFTVLLLEHNDS